MKAKLLISAEANAGKTTLIKNLENSLVINHDGKKFPFTNMFHKEVDSFDSVDELEKIITNAMLAYKEKTGNRPDYVIFDSVSKIFDTILTNCNKKFKNYDIYSNMNSQIAQFVQYVEDVVIANDIGAILISHAVHNQNTDKYDLVCNGKFAERGGYLSETNEGIFLELRNNKRIVHIKSTKFPARSLQTDFPESMPLEDFNLKKHLGIIEKSIANVNEFAL